MDSLLDFRPETHEQTSPLPTESHFNKLIHFPTETEEQTFFLPKTHEQTSSFPTRNT